MMFRSIIFTFLTCVTLAKGQAQNVTVTIPGSTVTFTMAKLPGGKFVLGANVKDKLAEADEHPAHEIVIEPFYMSIHELTYQEFDLFRNKEKDLDAQGTPRIEGVVRPSPPYEDPYHGMGGVNYPASGMTQFSALHYCKWLSEKTGEFYRLPTEAEWEYACKAGTSTSYFFGSKVKDLGQYAWFADNSGGKMHAVGTLKPNPWGLYDMLGNVGEWTLDQYDAAYYTQVTDGATQVWAMPTALHPRTVRGGSYQDGAVELRSSNRIKSDLEWKRRDPQIPKSFWWNTDAPFVGFRLIKPVNPPSKEDQEIFWATVLGS